jgi:hypothetical protein
MSQGGFCIDLGCGERCFCAGAGADMVRTVRSNCLKGRRHGDNPPLPGLLSHSLQPWHRIPSTPSPRCVAYSVLPRGQGTQLRAGHGPDVSRGQSERSQLCRWTGWQAGLVSWLVWLLLCIRCLYVKWATALLFFFFRILMTKLII